MKKLLFICLLICRVIFAKGQGGLPVTYEEIAKHYYQKYSPTYQDGYVSFEKRKSDWYAVYNTYKNDGWQPQEKYLFYNGKTGKFHELELDTNLNKDVNPSDYISPFDIRNFNLQPFYGYRGWYKDVIKEYQSRSNLTDDELNALGRAYSNYSLCLVSDQTGDAVKKEIWNLPFDINALTAAQIKEFIAISNKGIACFKKLADRNPEYETFVGKIGMKLANEHIVQYQVLLTYANDHATKMILPVDLYTDEQLKTAMDHLKGCPPNSILFTYGDNEFYPVHYLQKAKGIRKDVYVVNSTLLGLDRYIFRTGFSQYEASPVTIGVDASVYSGNNLNVIYVRDSNYIFPVSQFKSYLLPGKFDEYNNMTLAFDKIAISRKKQAGGQTDARAIIIADFKNLRYLTKDQWILLSMLENLDGRKICFTVEFYELKVLNEHLLKTNDLWIFDN